MAAGRAKGAVETPAERSAAPAKDPAPGRRRRRPADPGPARAAAQGRAADDEGPARVAPGQARVAREADRERPARGPAPRARARSGGPGPVRRDRRPRPPQGHPGALPAVADEPAAPRVPPPRGRPPGVRRRAFREEIRASLEQFSRVLPLDERGLAIVRAADPLPPPRLRRRGRLRRPGRPASTTIDEEHGTRGNRLFYLATQPSQFAEIVGPARPGRARPRAPRRRLAPDRHREAVRARPDSAKRLNREVGKVFRESQVYRIDHYLGKETVRNLLVFRFGNGIFEPLWNRRYVDHVQITVAESIGIENRGAFYEETGASRDVLQNHLLQLVSLVAMEPPATFEADALRDEKVKVLRAIATQPGRSATTSSAASTARAGSPRRRSRATARSRTSTPSRRPRRSWPPGSRSTTGAGPACPFYVRTGKRLPEALHRDRDPVPGGAPPPVPGGGGRPGPEPAGHPGPAGRGDHAALRRQGPGPRHGHPVGDDGLHVRVGVQRRLARRLRDAHPRRAPGRRLAVHPRRRGRGGVVHRRPDHRGVGRTRPAPDFPNYDAGTWGPPEADELLARDGRRWRRF